MFKIGERIILTEESHQSCNIFHERPGDMATIIGITGDQLDSFGTFYVLEFDRNIGGHDGIYYAKGKSGHCVVYGFDIKRAEKYFKRIQRQRKNNYY